MNKSLHASLLAQLRDWLGNAVLPENGRLPPERTLAEQFHVTRAELRKALAVLEAEGRLRRHVGRGTFLSPARGPSRSRIEDLAEVITPREAMQARMVLEPELASLAAFNATTSQIAELRSLSAQMRKVATWRDYETLNARFHNLIAEASSNRLLSEMHDIVSGVRRKVIWGHLNVRPVGPSADYHSFEEHDAIVAAIANRDRRGAADAMRRHLQTTNSSLVDDLSGGAPVVASSAAAMPTETLIGGN